jgi:hypothetical protein
MKIVQIRKSSWVHSGILVTSGSMILWFFLGPYDETRIIYDESPRFTLLLGLIFVGLFAYSLRELIARKPEIILTEEGIEIRAYGWNHWTLINSISMFVEKDSENGNREYLLLELKDGTEIKCMITDFDRSPAEILNLVRAFKNNTLAAD